MERVQGGDLEVWRRKSVKYFRERPFAAVFFYALTTIVIIYFVATGISGITGTQDKPVDNCDGDTDGQVDSADEDDGNDVQDDDDGGDGDQDEDEDIDGDDLMYEGLTTDEVTQMKLMLKRNVVRGLSIPTALRLAFHDCVGGCDGCLNLDNQDNGGLGDLIESLETLYQEQGYADIISRADFWALAGITAVDKGIEISNESCLEDDCAVPESGLVFQWGRQDCSTSPSTTVDVGLPGSLLDHDGVMDFFFDEFGFDANETVALMGAHTLGQMLPENSGHNGIWTPTEMTFFNNQFYKNLVDEDLTYRQREISEKFQWNAEGVVFMLNVDVALYIDIQTDAAGESSCDFSSCEAAPTATAVEAFAASNEVWIPAFTDVFTKMLAHGSTELFDTTDA